MLIFFREWLSTVAAKEQIDSFEKHPMISNLFVRERFVSMEVKSDDTVDTIRLHALDHLKDLASNPSHQNLPTLVVLCGAKKSGKSTAIRECARHASSLLQPGPYSWTDIHWFASGKTCECRRNVVMLLPCPPQSSNEQLSIKWFNESVLHKPMINPGDEPTSFSRHLRNAHLVPTFATVVLDDFDAQLTDSKVCFPLSLFSEPHLVRNGRYVAFRRMLPSSSLKNLSAMLKPPKHSTSSWSSLIQRRCISSRTNS